MKFLTAFATVLFSAQIMYANENFSCGEKRIAIRKYGKIELRVDCELIKGRMVVSEYKGNILHGSSQTFYRGSGWRRDSCFYLNGKENGLSLVWDSLGNVLGRSTSKNGVQVGKLERFYLGGNPSTKKFYNSNGREEGLIQEWWRNGNKKVELIAKDGQIISGKEYYPTGNLRISYVTKYQPRRGVFGTRYIQLESWSPEGRPSGKIVDGTGEYLLWPAEPTTPFYLHREIFKDSVLAKVDELDSSKVDQWFKNPPPVPQKNSGGKDSNAMKPPSPKP